MSSLLFFRALMRASGCAIAARRGPLNRVNEPICLKEAPMNLRSGNWIGRALMLTAASLLSAPAVAQSWPAKPITFVVVFAPGGTVDIVGRTLAAKLSQQLGQTVLVDNRIGAGGLIGAAAVAKAKPDGYTFLMLVSSHSVSETLYPKREYDLVKSFAPVSLIGTSPYWLLINPEARRSSTVKDLVAMVRAQPGKLTYASGGSGGLTHLSAEMMKSQGKLDITHVPFKGNAPALTEVMAGRVDMIFDQPASSESHVKAGKLKPLAVTSGKRLPSYPDVPTMSESGFPGFEVVSWFGAAFPAGTPREIIDKLNQEIAKALAAPEVKQKLEAAGVTPTPSSPAELGDLIKSEIPRWRRVIEEAGVKVE
jgi:tripartite-type tricarboxylate transporter receptor subunit TctC